VIDIKNINIFATELPKSWKISNLEDVVDILDRKRIPVNAKERADRIGNIPYYGATGQVGWIDDYLFDEELILLGEDGAPFFDSSKQKSFIIRGKSWVNNHAHVLRALNGLPNNYIKYYLDIFDYHGYVSGTTRLKLNQTLMRKIPVPLAPPNEQSRIVVEIEKQFSRLDEAVDTLKRIKANLKRYKASILKDAVEGKLTEEWRKSNPNVEPAGNLLERILVERRKKWEEAELAKMKAKGKEPNDDKWKKKYKEPSQADISKLNELPNEWKWLTSDQLFCFVTSGSRGWAKYYSNSGAVFLRIGNLSHDSVFLDLQKLQFVEPPRGAEGTRTRVQENDILISITADVGMIGVIPKGFKETYINQHISLVRPVRTVNPLYIAWYLASRPGQDQFGALQRGATKAGLGLDDIRSVNIPMPPFEEQKEIIFQIEKRLSIVDEIEIEVNKNLKRSDRLRQSILKKAFTGKLVPQINEDESLSNSQKQSA